MNKTAARSLRRLLALVQAVPISEQQDFVLNDFAEKWIADLTRQAKDDSKVYIGKKPYVSKVDVEELL